MLPLPAAVRSNKRQWRRQPPQCWFRNMRRSPPPEERSGTSAGIAEFLRLQGLPHIANVDSNEDTEDSIFLTTVDDDGDTSHDEATDDMTFETLVAESESLNVAGGSSRFSAAVRLLVSLPRRVCPEPSVVKPKSVGTNADTRPLGHEWHLDDQDRRVRRSLRIIYRKERMEARGS